MKINKYIFHLIIIVFILLALYPILFAVSNSFKHLSDAYSSTINLIPNPFTLENYVDLEDTIPLFRITLNTFIIASVITAFKIVTSFLAAFALTYFHFKFKRATYFLLISTIFIPFTVTMIPNYLIISEFDLIDSVWGVILPQLADAIGIFMLTQAMRNIPKPLIEAAQIDGISTFNIMKDHVLPIVRPAIASTAIWFFILAWNDYVWPLLMLRSRESYTLPLALQLFVSSEGGTNFTIAMALSVITMAIPLILYLVFQRYIINTFSSSGIK